MRTSLPFKGRRPVVANSAFVAENAVLIGEASNIQDNVVIHSEGDFPTLIESRVRVGHGAILHACTIETGCVIGMGSIVLSGASIGAGSMVAAGSVVLERFKVPSGVLAAGNPASVKKTLDGRAAKWLDRGAESYVELQRWYKGC